MLQSDYFSVKKNDISNFQLMLCYISASSFTIMFDNPLTVYRQMIQQSSFDPKLTQEKAKQMFFKSPVNVAFSGITPRLFGIFLKKFPVYGILSSVCYLRNEKEVISATSTMISGVLSTSIINPIRFIEKQQRSSLLENGNKKSIRSILKKSSELHFRPLYRGIIPHIGHSVVSSSLGLCGQPKLQKYITKQLQTKSKMGDFTANILASCCVSPFYVIVTNPLTRMEVMMQTTPISKQVPTLLETIQLLKLDYQKFGMKGFMRGQTVGIVKAVVHLTIFHQIRLFLIEKTKSYNRNKM